MAVREETFICPDCSGTGTSMEPRAYSNTLDRMKTILAPARCTNCRGEGRIPTG